MKNKNINLYRLSICGVGYIGEGKYSKEQTFIIYERWRGMIKRVVSVNSKIRNPSYHSTTVCEEWWCLQNFGEWFEENWKPWMDSTWHLDKDILIKGNKVYSGTTCTLVPAIINTIFTKSNKIRGKYPIGVYKDGKKFRACISKNDKTLKLGTFNTAEEAFKCYKFHKEAYIKEIADEWKDLIDPKVYNVMDNYEVEITD